MKKENKYPSPVEGEGTRRVGEGEKKANSLLCPLIRALPTFSLRGRRHSGFTLIELLVVVLIIGILAAIALPMYQKAVEKSRAMQGLALIKTFGEAADRYVLANGTYPSSLEDLDVSLPADFTGTEKYYAQTVNPRSNGTWSIGLENSPQFSTGAYAVHIGLLKGKYKGGGFSYYLKDYLEVKAHHVYCIEVSGQITPAGVFCGKVFNAPLGHSSGVRLYPL